MGVRVIGGYTPGGGGGTPESVGLRPWIEWFPSLDRGGVDVGGLCVGCRHNGIVYAAISLHSDR